MTQGDTLQEAYEMAVDCLGPALSIKEDKKQPFPATSYLENISLKNNEYLVIIEFNLLEYTKRTNSKAVKKTLSIPEWLNEAAIAKGINFSQVLQEALLTKVQL